MKESTIQQIGLRLEQERERLGLTQADLARRALVSPNTQVKYEGATTYPDAVYLAKFAHLGADVLYIVTGRRTPELLEVDGQNAVLDHDEAELLQNYRHALDDGKAAARAVLVAVTRPARWREVEETKPEMVMAPPRVFQRATMVGAHPVASPAAPPRPRRKTASGESD